MSDPNPFSKQLSNKEHVTFMDTNCMAKAVMTTVGGGAMGFLMAMFMNAVEMRDLDYGRTKQATRYVIRRDFNKMKGMARSFATFGCCFSVFECQIEKLRHKDDGLNSFIAGAFTSMLLAAEAVGWRGVLFTGLGGGIFGMGMYKLQMKYMH